MTNDNRIRNGGIIEVFVSLKIPTKVYEVAYGFHRIADYKTFDEYVSDMVVRDIEMMTENGEMTHDLIHEKLTGKNSPYMQHQKEHWKGINKRLKKMSKEESSV